jgi:hypothetical protein
MLYIFCGLGLVLLGIVLEDVVVGEWFSLVVGIGFLMDSC